MKRIFLNKTVRLAGKILTLMGFSLVFAACYASAPYEPELRIDEDMIYHTDEPSQADAPGTSTADAENL